MYLVTGGSLLCACVIVCICAANGDACDVEGSGSCVASSRSSSYQGSSLLQKRHSPHSADPVPGTDSENERLELLCYLKDKLQEPFKKAIMSLSGSKPFGEALQHKRCAAVSNSGALLKFAYGTLIDDADAVIRFNDARITGFEQYVGTRETVRIGNHLTPSTFASEAVLNRKKLQVAPGASYLLGLDASTEAHMNLLPQKYPESHFYAWPSYSLRELAANVFQEIYSDRWTNRKALAFPKGSRNLTTGCIGMFFALSFCESVEAFQFAASEYADRDPYNYYGERPGGADASDNFAHALWGAEHDLWKRISLNSTYDMAKTGRALIPGFDAIECKRDSYDPPHLNLGQQREVTESTG